MRLVIMVRPSVAVQVEVVHVSAQNTGRAGLANKGGIVAELLVNGRTRLSFLTAHLEAHEGAIKYQTRVSTMADILSGTKQKQHDCSLTAHYSFVMGDLNFRTELPNHLKLGEAEHKQRVRDMVAGKDWEALNSVDELHRALRNKDCLVGYQTLFCNFPPTFKVERRAGYEYIDKRRPSYTDRVLWKTNHGLDNKVRPLVYEPIDDFTSSDHKPVRAAFAVQLNTPFTLRPKMTRRRSVMNLSGILNKKKDRTSVVAHKERYHLFVSNISCEIYGRTKRSTLVDLQRLGSGLGDSAPNPYVCLISDPPEALRQKNALKGWSRVRNAVLKSHRHGSKSSFLTAKGYPRSSIQKQTYTANWKTEEICSEIKTHGSDGKPIDLTGAMLRLTIMDYRTSSDDVVMGTFAFNLVDLMRSCRPSTRVPSRGDKIRKAPTEVAGSLQRQHQRRGSLMNIFRWSAHEVDDDDEEPDPIATADIDEPLVKNGVETGRIRCTIEAWLMDESTFKAFGGSVGGAHFMSGSRNNCVPDSNGRTTGGGRPSLITGRRRRGSAASESPRRRNATLSMQ